MPKQKENELEEAIEIGESTSVAARVGADVALGVTAGFLTWLVLSLIL